MLPLVVLFSLLGGIGAMSLAGAFLILSERVRTALVPMLVSYATGTLLGAALLALLPHALMQAEPLPVLETVLVAILGLFILEKAVLLHHGHHEGHHRFAASGVLILVGDSVHNFVDGVAIAAAFASSVPVGIAAGLAVISHEVPQEVGDFGILLNAGYGRLRAFLYNSAAALTTLPGALSGYALLETIRPLVPYVLAVSAASFLYIGMADLVPHLHERADTRASICQVLLILVGIATIILVDRLAGHA